MMLHQDASRHAWLPQAPPLDLVVTMDDATSEIYSALLVEEEGTASTFRALLEVFGRHGLPLSLYTDRGSHYFHTPTRAARWIVASRAGWPRAVASGRWHIAAYSPQARGRSERLFQTLQDRLPKELALAGITTMDAANAWLRDSYIPAHNARFTVPAEQEGSAFVAVPELELAEVLCVQEERVVGNDNCVSWPRRRTIQPLHPVMHRPEHLHIPIARQEADRCGNERSHADSSPPRGICFDSLAEGFGVHGYVNSHYQALPVLSLSGSSTRDTGAWCRTSHAEFGLSHSSL